MSEQLDQQLRDRRHRLMYEIELSMLYHRKRERVFELCDRGAKAIAVIAGSAVFARVIGDYALPWFAAAVALTSALSLVFALSERARRHAEFAIQFGELGAEFARKGTASYTDDDLSVCDSKIRLLEAKEPASLGALVRICQNEIAIAQGASDYVTPVPLHQRMLAHIWDFPSPKRPFPQQTRRTPDI